MSTAAEVYGKDIAYKDDFILSAKGDLDTIEGVDNVKNALFRRLVTIPGALVHRPTYGVGISLFQNTINSLDTKRKIALAIKEDFAKDPRVESVSSVSFESADNNNAMVELRVKIKLVGYDEMTMTFLPGV